MPPRAEMITTPTASEPSVIAASVASSRSSVVRASTPASNATTATPAPTPPSVMAGRDRPETR